MPGIAQLVGDPFGPGETLTLAGVVPTAEVGIAVESDRWEGSLTFTGVTADASAPATLRIADEPQKSVIELADGTTVAPSHVSGARRPLAPLIGRARRDGRALFVVVRPQARLTGFGIGHSCAQTTSTIQQRAIRGHRGRLVRLRFRYDPRARVLFAVSLSRSGADSVTVCSPIRLTAAIRRTGRRAPGKPAHPSVTRRR